MPSPIKRRYPKAVDEVIWALLVARVRPGEILRRIREGEANLDRAYDMPKSTFEEKKRQLKLKRGDPRDYVEPGDGPSTAEAIEARVLSIANREIRLIEAKVRRGEELTAGEMTKAEKVMRMAKDAKPPTSKPANLDRAKKGRKAQQDSPVTRLNDLARQVDTSYAQRARVPRA